MTRKRIIGWVLGSIGFLILLVLVGGFFLLRSRGFHQYVLSKVIQKANEATGGRVEIRGFDFRLRNLTANVYGLIIHGTEPDKEKPLLKIDHIFIDLKLVSLIHHKVDLIEIIVEHPVVRLISDKNGKSNIPQPDTPKDENKQPINLFDLGINHVLLSNGEVYYNQERNPLEADLHDLRAEVSYQLLRSQYTGAISYRNGRLRIPNRALFAHNLDVNFTATPSELNVSSAVLSVQSSRVQLSAKVTDFGNPRVAGNYQVLIHTQDFRPLLSSSSSAAGDVVLSGSMQYQNVPGQSFLRTAVLHGKLESRELQVVTPQAHLPVRAIRSDYELVNGNVRATGFAADLLGGHLTAEFNLANMETTPVARFHGDVRGISLRVIRESALSPQIRTVPLTGTIDGSAEGGWTGDVKNLKIRSDVSMKGAVAQDRNSSSVPLNAAIHLAYDGPHNILTLTDTFFRSLQTTVAVNGAVGDHSNLRVEARANDLHEIGQLADVLRNVKNSSSPPLNLGGTATVSARVEGTVQKPRITAQVRTQNLQVMSGHWRTVQFDAEASPSEVVVSNGSLQAEPKGQASFSMKADLHDWQYAPTNPITANVSVRQMPVHSLVQLAGKDYPVSGTLAVDVSLRGSQQSPVGNGSVHITQAVVYEQPIQNVSLNFEAANDTINSKLEIQTPAGNTTANIILQPKAHSYELKLNAPAIDLAELEAVKAKNIPLTGKLNLTANGKGTFDNPQVSVTAAIPTLDVRQAQVRQVRAQIDLADHRAKLNLDSEVASAFIQTHATVDLSGEYNTEASFDTKGIPLAPLIALYKPVPDQLKGLIELHATAKGPAKDPSRMEAHLVIPTFNASYEQLQIGNSGPIKADYVNSVITIAPSELKGTETSLRISGEIPVKGSAPPHLTVAGNVDMKLLKIVSSDVQSSGQVILDLHATRSASANLGIQGKVQVQDVALNTTTSPMGVEKLNGVFDIQDNDVRLNNITAQVGGGQLTAGGTITYRPSLVFNVAIKGSDIRVRYPEGVRTLVDAQLALTGTSEDSNMTGRVLINNLSFTQDFDLGDFIGQFSGGGSAPPSGEGFTQNMKLNISVQTTSRLNLVSSTVSLKGQADLRIVGTAADPVIVGRTDLTGGEIFLMNKRYELVRGIINFTNPSQTEPVINVLVTTTVNQYKLSMTFIGPVDRLRTSYTSEPPLPPVDIINLLARGQTTEEAAPASLNANSVLAQGLASQVSGRIQKLAGLSSLQIDPTLGGNGTNPTARVAIQQRVTKNFIFTFSTDVTDPESQVVQGEYQVDNHWSVTASRNQYGGYAFDAKYHKTF